MTPVTTDRTDAQQQERMNEARDKQNKQRAQMSAEKEHEYIERLEKTAGEEGHPGVEIPEEHDPANPLTILAPENRTEDNGTDSLVEPTGGIKTAHPERFYPSGRPYTQTTAPEDVVEATLKQLAELHNADVKALNVKDQEREEVLTGRRPDVPAIEPVGEVNPADAEQSPKPRPLRAESKPIPGESPEDREARDKEQREQRERDQREAREARTKKS